MVSHNLVNVALQWDHKGTGPLTPSSFVTNKSDRDRSLCVLNSRCPYKMYSSNAFDGATSSNEMHTRRRECIRAHLHKCHNIECRPGDMTLIACVACPPFNGQPTYVEKGAFPEHINQWH